MFNLDLSKIIASTEAPTTQLRGEISSSTLTMYNDFTSSLLEIFLPKSDERTLNELYREIYIYDSVCGPAVDLISTLPFSEFTLSGVDDKSVLRIFEESIDQLKPSTLLPHVTVSYLVLGKVIGSLIFNESKGIFTDLVIHDPDQCILTAIPLRGYDPKIDLKPSREFAKFLRSTDPRDKEALKEISHDLLTKMLKGSKIPLDPISTLFLPRAPVVNPFGMSIYTRILPIWLIEKALMRGTIIGAWRRQRPILHVTAGTDEWDPSPDQLQELAQLFISADLDPQGAVVATKQGVETSETRSGADFWKVSDDWDVTSNTKMRAMGINEAFLSGEASYNTAEVALSVFIENLRSYREFITRKVFYEKVFYLLAKFHKIYKRKAVETTHRVRLSASDSDLMLPEIAWHKHLKPEADSTVLELYKSVQEAGIPIPLRVMAAAGGLNLDKIVNGMEEDLRLRKTLVDYKNRIKELQPKPEEGEEGGEETSEESLYSQTTEGPLNQTLNVVSLLPQGPDQPKKNFITGE